MNVKPIPDILLGDSITLLIPASGKWNETKINNVRVERTNAVSGYSPQKVCDNTEIAVWYDHIRSSPKAEFSAGMRVKYRGEIYEITECRNYFADAPHHCKFKARKLGGEYK